MARLRKLRRPGPPSRNSRTPRDDNGHGRAPDRPEVAPQPDQGLGTVEQAIDRMGERLSDFFPHMAAPASEMPEEQDPGEIEADLGVSPEQGGTEAEVEHQPAQVGAGALDPDLPVSVEPLLGDWKSDPQIMRVRLEDKLGQIQDGSYFDILEVSVDGSPERIERAFAELCDQFGDERFSSEELQDLRPRAEFVRRILQEAHQVLGNPNLLQLYRQALQSGL